ncbi:MAG: ATP-binding protein [Oscillospiraceae bacterium]
MNPEAITKALEIISKKKQFAIETYNSHVEEINTKIPEIAMLNNHLSSVSKEIIMCSFDKSVDLKTKLEEIENDSIQTQKKIESILVSNGYDANYLKINYTCPLCRDTGFKKDKNGLEVNEYCQCLVDLTKQISAEQINKSSTLTTFSFETFELGHYSKNEYVPNSDTTIYLYTIGMVQMLKDYANNFKVNQKDVNSNSPSIIMYGKTGLGKTHLSLAIADKIIQKGFSVVYDSADNLFSRLADENFNHGYNNEYNNHKRKILETILSVDLLIIDDLGTEMENKYYKSVLYNIINTRYIRSLPMIINTNLSLKDLGSKYDERILSRILSYQNVEFFGRDYREISHKDNNLMKKYIQIKKQNPFDFDGKNSF